MPKFNVTVSRAGYSSADFEVEAKSETEAEQKALEKAGNHEFREKDANYEVDNVAEVKNG